MKQLMSRFLERSRLPLASCFLSEVVYQCSFFILTVYLFIFSILFS